MSRSRSACGVLTRGAMNMRVLASCVMLSALIGCSPSQEEEASPPSDVGETTAPLTWVGPSSGDLQAGDVVELTVAVDDARAKSVRFEVDGAELAVCDPSAPEEDCKKGATWRWSTTFTPGPHSLRATLVRDGAPDVVAEQSIEVARELPDVVDDVSELTDDDDDLLLDEPALDEAAPDPIELGDPQSATRQTYDPTRAFHNVFGGISWKVSLQRVRLRSGLPLGSVSQVARCMARYGTSIRKFADNRGLSRASIVATAITESGCTNPAGSSDGLSSGPMQVTASTCSSITGLSRATCRVRMHSQPSFSFDVGSRYMASSYQRRQHRRDPPKIAAAYNAGSIRSTRSNRWHMVSTGNHIDRWVRAYNAYRSWVLRKQKTMAAGGGSSAVDVANDVDLVFDGEHVTRAADLAKSSLEREGQVVFVGDWASRDGAFHHFEHGAWHDDTE